MKRYKNKIDAIPNHFDTINEASEFWDSHDLGDYWDQTKEVHFEVEIEYEKNYYALEKEISEKIEEIAKSRGVSAETMVNLWLKEKISTLTSH